MSAGMHLQDSQHQRPSVCQGQLFEYKSERTSKSASSKHSDLKRCQQSGFLAFEKLK